MAESNSESPSKRGFRGLLISLLTSIAGLLSGAVLMYASPLVDMVIKPAKPIANFQVETNGLTIVLQNKSTGGYEGWWDFGDGSALEPFASDQPSISHTYAKAASYMVKLSLKNLVHEENDRTVTVALDQGGGTSLPSIDTFDLVPTHGDYAPATYRLVSTVKNANLCVFAVGNKALEFNPDAANGTQERLLTFREPGNHVVKLAAYNGKQAIEKTAMAVVKQARAGTVTATVEMSCEAMHIEDKSTNQLTVPFQFPADQKGNTAVATYVIPADMGFQFVKANILPGQQNPHIKSAKVEVDQAKHDKAVVTCELIRPTGRQATGTSTVQISLTQRRQSAATTKILDPVSVNLNVPGSTKVPLPTMANGWHAKNHTITLTLQQDAKKVSWKPGDLPRNVPVQMSPATSLMVTAVEESGQLRIDVVETKKPIGFVGN